ncbi:hypothetical protein HYR54_03715 [Candidatus Acetothermia bacterium]|nr:hypothetical protein [Candidatus Acetothermia bacterium]
MTTTNSNSASHKDWLNAIAARGMVLGYVEMAGLDLVDDPQKQGYFEVFKDDFPSVGEYLIGEISEGWKLVQPLLIRYEKDEDGCYIFSDDIFLVYGQGNTTQEAKEDYIISLIEYYEIIAKKAPYSNTATQQLLGKLQSYLRKIGE